MRKAANYSSNTYLSGDIHLVLSGAIIMDQGSIIAGKPAFLTFFWRFHRLDGKIASFSPVQSKIAAKIPLGAKFEHNRLRNRRDKAGDTHIGLARGDSQLRSR